MVLSNDAQIEKVFFFWCLLITLFGLLLAPPCFAQQEKESEAPRTSRRLRDRDRNRESDEERGRTESIRRHYLSGNVALNSDKEVGNDVADTSSTLNVYYLRDYGYYGIGPIINLKSSSSGSLSKELLSLGGAARFNFIENKVGNDFIPNLFMKAILGTDRTKSKIGTTKISLTTWEVGLGLDFYPFSRFIALTPAITYSQLSTKVDESTITTTTSSLSMGMALSF